MRRRALLLALLAAPVAQAELVDAAFTPQDDFRAGDFVASLKNFVTDILEYHHGAPFNDALVAEFDRGHRQMFQMFVDKGYLTHYNMNLRRLKNGFIVEAGFARRFKPYFTFRITYVSMTGKTIDDGFIY